MRTSFLILPVVLFSSLLYANENTTLSAGPKASDFQKGDKVYIGHRKPQEATVLDSGVTGPRQLQVQLNSGEIKSVSITFHMVMKASGCNQEGVCVGDERFMLAWESNWTRTPRIPKVRILAVGYWGRALGVVDQPNEAYERGAIVPGSTGNVPEKITDVPGDVQAQIIATVRNFLYCPGEVVSYKPMEFSYIVESNGIRQLYSRECDDPVAKAKRVAQQGHRLAQMRELKALAAELGALNAPKDLGD